MIVGWAANRGGGEAGAVSVLVAVLLPVMILLGSFVIDGGSWFQHEAHLQLQADAGALAGAQEFNALACQDAAVDARAQQYSGMAGGDTPLHNQLTGNTTSVFEKINSQAYPSQPNPPASDSTPMTGSPCKDALLDLKLTETSLPWYFQAIGVGGINAHARVSVLQQTAGSGFLPIAVNETTPVAATAYFINEDTSAILASSPLTNTGTNGAGQAVWSSPAPASVNVNAAHVGVIVALSGTASNTTCPSNSQLVNCFDLNPGPSLVHIQGYSTSGTGTTKAPIARSVTLQPGAGTSPCTDGYFSNATGDCTFGLMATIDMGANPNPTGVTVTAAVAGTTTPLTYSGGTWGGSATLPVGTGSNQVDITVKCNATVTGSPCFTGKARNNTTATLSDVQRSYAASSTTSGTVDSATVWENTIANPDANSFVVGSTHNLGVTIAVAGSLQNAQSVSDPVYVMRFGNGTSTSQTGAIACPPGGQGGLRTSLISGCTGTYQCNGASAAGCISDPGCANTNPTAGQTPPPPADCVLTDNGLKTGQFRQGLSTRLANQSCPNNWASYPNIPPTDPRIVQVFITSYGAFGGSGGSAYPIETFASFYVTAWDGDPCSSDSPTPNDQIWGHFIKYIGFSDPNPVGSGACVLSSFGSCVTVVTR
jgi:Putative Flp pilus-assembly TadE/G-like